MTKSGTREKPTKGIMGGQNRSGVIGDCQESQKADRRWVGVVGDQSGSRDLTKGLQTLEMQDANINEKPLKDKKGQQE